jgi:crotonobetainyl-CoA:carnitine CoA-transferase CaiB-like acyl-CoA transferase
VSEATPAQSSAAARPPLAGVRVLDLTTFLSGPFATQILADLGAEVIKVESPAGDSSRAIPPHVVGEDSVYFLATNRGKRSIVVDLKTAAGRELVRGLIAEVDVVVENFRPGVAARLDLDPEVLAEAHPALVWASISGFGQTGPWRERPAYDMVVQALSGVMSLTGEPGRPAVRTGVPIGDLAAGMYAVIGVLAALQGRVEGGQGRRLDISMLDCQLALLSYQAAYALHAGTTPGPQGRAHDSIPTYRSFTGADGREFVVTANTEVMWARLCEVLGLDELPGEAAFRDQAARLAHRDRLWPILEEAFVTAPAATWVERLVAAGVPAALIRTVPEALADARATGRQMVLELDDGDHHVEVVGDPIHYPGRVPTPTYPPRLGAHTEELLRDLLGLSPAEVTQLRRAGVVGGP